MHHLGKLIGLHQRSISTLLRVEDERLRQWFNVRRIHAIQYITSNSMLMRGNVERTSIHRPKDEALIWRDEGDDLGCISGIPLSFVFAALVYSSEILTVNRAGAKIEDACSWYPAAVALNRRVCQSIAPCAAQLRSRSWPGCELLRKIPHRRILFSGADEQLH